MSRVSSVEARTLASSVLPTPASPSRSRGRPSRRPRKTEVIKRAIGDVSVLGERGLQAVDGVGMVGHMTTLARPRFAMRFARPTIEGATRGASWPTSPRSDQLTATPRTPAARAASRWPSRTRTPILPWGGRLDEIAQERFNRTDWIELAAAVILALATIVAAWSAYQATRWGGVQASSSRSAIEAKTDAAQQTSVLRGPGPGRRAGLDPVAPAGSR